MFCSVIEDLIYGTFTVTAGTSAQSCYYVECVSIMFTREPVLHCDLLRVVCRWSGGGGGGCLGEREVSFERL